MTWKCPTDCTCYRCLEKMADPNCSGCEGDGYVIFYSPVTASERMCKCVEDKHAKRCEKAEREQQKERKGI